MESNLTCLIHRSRVLAVCCAEACESRLACSKCLAFKHNECEKNFLFLEDLNSNNVGNILQMPILDNIFPREKYQDLFAPSGDLIYKNKISSIFAELLDKIKESLRIFEETLLQKYGNVSKSQDFKDKIIKILELDKLTDKLAETRTENLQWSLDTLKIARIGRSSALNELRQYKKQIQPEIETIDSISNLKILADSISKELNDSLYISSVSREFLKFSYTYKSDYHLECDNMKTIKHSGKDKEYACTFINTTFTPNSGIYYWNLMFSNLKSFGKGPYYWCCFGIVEEKKWDKDKTDFGFRFDMNFCTDGYGTGGLKVIKNELKYNLEGKVLECSFDSSEAIFTVKHRDKLLCIGKAEKGINYKPHVITYNKRNTCTIID